MHLKNVLTRNSSKKLCILHPITFIFSSSLFSLISFLLAFSKDPSSPPFFLPHLYPSVCMSMHYKKPRLPPGFLSRSDVVAWEEWRRCLIGSRWCSSQERNTGGGKWQKGNRAPCRKARRGARNERRRGSGAKKGGDWGRQMKRGNVRGDRWMNECLCVPRRGKCQFTTPSKCFKLKWCLESGWREIHSDSKHPLFIQLQILPEWSLENS